MSVIVKNAGDNTVAIPGTSNQTGNHAPQLPWKKLPKGRFAIIFAHCVANKLGYTDDRMAKLHQFPSDSDFGYFFNKMAPWFAKYYNDYRRSTGYTGRLEPFSGEDAGNRVRYQFVKPGRKTGHDPQARLYGTTTEYYQSIHQRRPGGLMEVWTRCSEEIFKRLEKCEIPFTEQEAEEWGQ